jgi:hypothetical protein
MPKVEDDWEVTRKSADDDTGVQINAKTTPDGHAGEIL